MSTISQVSDMAASADAETLVANSNGSQGRFLRMLPSSLTALTKSVTKAGSWVFQKAKAQQARKNLRVCESVSLGEKRFVAVVQVDGERFLIGGSPSSLALLTTLKASTSFKETLERCQEAEKVS